MEKTTISKSSAKAVASTLERMLHIEANTSSCILLHQPKAPKELKQFRRDK